jgi:hypothetical protein
MLTNDQKEILITYFSTVLECYKVLTACLLSIFVPQFCPETNATCSLSENFTNLTQFNEFVITLNFVTLASFMYLYYIQGKRETYIINHLDVNKNKSDNSLEENLKSHSKGERIFKRIKEQNRKVYNLIKRCMGIFYLNVLFSCILIFYYYYDGFRSVTSLIAYVLLVSQKLYFMYSTMKKSISNEQDLNDSETSFPTPKGLRSSFELALSLTSLEPVSYNDIDPDYVESRQSVIEMNKLETSTIASLSESKEIPNRNEIKPNDEIKKIEPIIARDLQSEEDYNKDIDQSVTDDRSHFGVGIASGSEHLPVLGSRSSCENEVSELLRDSVTKIDVKQSPKKINQIEIENDNILEKETNIDNILNEITIKTPSGSKTEFSNRNGEK